MSEKQITIRNIDGRLEKVVHKPSSCASCGMATLHPREYHPFAACLMFKASGNGGQVRGNLEAVVEFGIQSVREAP